MSQWHYRMEQYILSDVEDQDYLDALGEKGRGLVYLDKLSRAQTGAQMKWLAVFKKQVMHYGKHSISISTHLTAKS